MDKNSRYNLIKSIASKHALVPLIPPSEIDSKEEAKIASEHNDDESIINEDEQVPGISRALYSQIEKPTRKKERDEAALTKSEKEQVAKELHEYRIIKARKLPLVVISKPIFA